MARGKPPVLVPTRSAGIKLMVHGGKLVAIKVLPTAAKMLRDAYRLRGAQPVAPAPPSVFVLAEDDNFTPRDSPLQIGSWLGVRVYVDIPGILEARKANGE
jgi:hypothetical protein